MKGAHTYRLLLCIRLLFHCTGWHKNWHILYAL